MLNLLCRKQLISQDKVRKSKANSQQFVTPVLMVQTSMLLGRKILERVRLVTAKNQHRHRVRQSRLQLVLLVKSTVRLQNALGVGVSLIIIETNVQPRMLCVTVAKKLGILLKCVVVVKVQTKLTLLNKSISQIQRWMILKLKLSRCFWVK